MGNPALSCFDAGRGVGTDSGDIALRELAALEGVADTAASMTSISDKNIHRNMERYIRE